MLNAFDEQQLEQDDTQNVPVQRKEQQQQQQQQGLPESRPIKSEPHTRKDGIDADYIAVTGIVRSVSTKFENVTVGGYAVAWADNALPIKSGSYAGEANLNMFMELVAVKAALKACPSDLSLAIGVKDNQTVGLINSKKFPKNIKRKRLVGPLMSEVRILLRKRSGKVHAVRMVAESVSESLKKIQAIATQEAVVAQQERMNLDPVQIEAILSRTSASTDTTTIAGQTSQTPPPEVPELLLGVRGADEETTIPSSSTKQTSIERRNGDVEDTVYEFEQTVETTTVEKTELVTTDSTGKENGEKEKEGVSHIHADGENSDLNGNKRLRSWDDDSDNEPTAERERSSNKKPRTGELSPSSTSWFGWVKSIFGIKQ